ncbi:MAG: T9SS type A sorting domain-containing protein [Bacteroidota bacterium]
MIKFYPYFVLVFLFLLTGSISAQTLWTGPKNTFTKANNADHTLEANQDRITSNVWITRKTQWSIFNIATEDLTSKPACDNPAPVDTEWALGTIADGIQNLTFGEFRSPVFTNCNARTAVAQDAVLHLISEDIYIDIKFLSWTAGGMGGGFSYERSTAAPMVSTQEVQEDVFVTLYPNPAQDALKLVGLETVKPLDYNIYDVTGSVVQNGTFTANETITIEALPKGVYFFNIAEYGSMQKFVKL